MELAGEVLGRHRMIFVTLTRRCSSNSGQDLAVVSKLLGHSDLGTTSDVYAHLTLRMSRDASDRVDRLLRVG